MKNYLIAGIIGMAGVASAMDAQVEQGNHFFECENIYLNVDAGILLQQDNHFVEKFGAGIIDHTASYDPGARFDIAAGYSFTECLAVEFETGVLWNSIDKLDGIPLSQNNLSVVQWGIPFMTSLIYHFHPMGKFTPFVGVGLGGILNVVDFNGGSGRTTQNDFQFAYQAQAGLTYQLCRHSTVSLTYKFLGSLDQSYPYYGERIEFQGVYTHSVLLSFNWKF